jgi:hypothetical protein
MDLYGFYTIFEKKGGQPTGFFRKWGVTFLGFQNF